MQNDVYDHMARDVESDLVEYIMGLWHMEKMRKQRKNYSGTINLEATGINVIRKHVKPVTKPEQTK